MHCLINKLPDYGIFGAIEIVCLQRDTRDGYQLAHPALAGCILNPRHFIASKELSLRLDSYGWDNVAVARGIRTIPVAEDQQTWLVNVVTHTRKGYTLGIFNEEDCRYILEQIPDDKRILAFTRHDVGGVDSEYVNSIVIPLNGLPI